MKHLVTYKTTKTQDIYKMNAKSMLLCYKKFYPFQISNKCEYVMFETFSENLILFCV